ncbi:MAG: ribosome biogenesis GTPase A [Flavobacteriales bacterium]|jgi:ribosome biogenesis GTPase A
MILRNHAVDRVIVRALGARLMFRCCVLWARVVFESSVRIYDMNVRQEVTPCCIKGIIRLKSLPRTKVVMLINWYPGHMHKARKKVQEILPTIDIVIEVIDARLPYSSTNPMIEKLRGQKPYLKVLSKSDLADPEVTQLWLDHIREQNNTDALAITTEKKVIARTIPNRILKMFPDRDLLKRPIKALIMGIPNVGKSTLINTLANKKIASVGNEPAITKAQQQIHIGNGIALIDTPGMTWPKSKNEIINYRLATSGAIRDTALEYDDVAMFAMEFMLERYPEYVAKGYQIQNLADTPLEALEQIAKRRGCMQRGGADYLRVGELFVRELRAGKLGLITLERPGPDCDQEKES